MKYTKPLPGFFTNLLNAYNFGIDNNDTGISEIEIRQILQDKYGVWFINFDFGKQRCTKCVMPDSVINQIVICNLEDIEIFAAFLHTEEKINFDPAITFEEYLNEQSKPVYGKAGSNRRNEILEYCKTVCDQTNVDLYEIVAHIFLNN